MSVLKEGDLIEWNFEDEHQIEMFGKTHQSEIAHVDMEDEVYCVYADYGIDKIPFSQAKKV